MTVVLICGICRAIQSQVDDQDVYCTFGLKWYSDNNEFVVDSMGCQTIIKYGELRTVFVLIIT